MTKLVRSLPILALAVAAAAPAYAQTAATANIGARLLRPLKLLKVNDMEFGTLMVTDWTLAGTAVLTPAGAYGTISNATALNLGGPVNAGAPQAASFTLAGSAGRAYKVWLTATAVTMKSVTGSSTITADTFTFTDATGGTFPAGGGTALPTAKPGSTNATLSGTVTTGVTDTINAGGTLRWGANLTDDGDYTAAAQAAGNGLTVNVAYN